jgi:cathepsin L
MKTVGVITLIAALGLAFIAMYPADTQMDEQFEQFIVQYGKNYASEGEMTFRREVFKANMQKAAELQRLNPRAEFGMTIFSDQTESEMMQRMGAIAPTSFDESIPVHTQESEPNGDLDWNKYLEPVQNQGSCGSCWAFSATATFEARHYMKSGKEYKLSEQEAVDCSSSQYGCNGGWYEAVWKMVQTDKFCTLNSYPYKAVKGSCKKSTCDGKANDKGYTFVKKTETAMMDALKSGPISIALDASTWSSYRGGVMDHCSNGMNHAVVLTGYSASDNAWKVRNSWGTGWGEKGYIRLAYGKNMCNLTYKPAYPTF